MLSTIRSMLLYFTEHVQRQVTCGCNYLLWFQVSSFCSRGDAQIVMTSSQPCLTALHLASHACRLAAVLSRERDASTAYLCALPTVEQWALPARIQLDALLARTAYPSGHDLRLKPHQLVFVLAGSILVRRALYPGGSAGAAQRKEAARLHGKLAGKHVASKEPPRHCLTSTTVRRHQHAKTCTKRHT